ncbi:MAG: hypothetical protein ACYDHE_06400 [Candidatus Acidiferrales bacterium]
MFRKILVAVGGSEHASETVPVVTGLAKAFDSDVLVVHMRERVVASPTLRLQLTGQPRWGSEPSVARRSIRVFTGPLNSKRGIGLTPEHRLM